MASRPSDAPIWLVNPSSEALAAQLRRQHHRRVLQEAFLAETRDDACLEDAARRVNEAGLQGELDLGALALGQRTELCVALLDALLEAAREDVARLRTLAD